MNYMEIYKDEICNGKGIGVSLFVSGCPFHCKNCFNSSTWDFSSGKPFTPEVQQKFLNLAAKPYVDRISLLGGEPLAKQNFGTIMDLVLAIHSRLGRDKKIWLYTGYTFEEVYKDNTLVTILPLLDYMVDGRFIDEKKDLSLAFRGSSNQQIWHNTSNLWKNVTDTF